MIDPWLCASAPSRRPEELPAAVRILQSLDITAHDG
jgi:hypothetical protein